ncbi:MAG: rhodanese-like domain-containing protein [Gammaproteobacteria bacterium]|nr:rhodanese-like domain-containing protein [Gammaproteobacteria bacterium]
MGRLFEFIGNHIILASAFVVVLMLVVRNEVARGGKSVSPQQLVHMLNRDKAVVLDLRERKEFTEGHIIDAINIPQASLDSRINELEPYRERPVIVACKMGQQAGAAGNILRKAGFSNVMRLSGGMTGWRGDNLPVVKG